MPAVDEDDDRYVVPEDLLTRWLKTPEPRIPFAEFVEPTFGEFRTAPALKPRGTGGHFVLPNQ